MARGQWVQCDSSPSVTCTTQKVGIGATTTAPTSQLTVKGTTSMYLPTSTGTLLWMGATNGATSVLSVTESNLVTFTNVDIRDGGGTQRIFFPAYVGNVFFNHIGNVGIGLTNPSYKLHVVGDTYSSGNVRAGGNLIMGQDTVPVMLQGVANGGAIQIKANSATTDRWLRLGQVDNNGVFYPYMHMSDGGNVGIGTTAPGAKLEVTRSSQYDGEATAGIALTDTPYPYNTKLDMGVDPAINAAYIQTQATTSYGTKNLALQAMGGNVGIGITAPTSKLHVVGAVRVQGTLTADQVIGATYQDIAEWVPATEPLAPGTVVVLDRRAANHVTSSARPYDTTVAGVVSEKPGVILGEKGENRAQIATTGRVRVNVDATAGPIEIGDLLVTSGKAGTAMKSEPLMLAGVAIHRPGTVIGKALEPLEAGQGQILVLLSLQ